jgi:hypothetical protein
MMLQDYGYLTHRSSAVSGYRLFPRIAGATNPPQESQRRGSPRKRTI